MIKKHLMKAVLLGLFISTLYTGSAYAMEVSSPSSVGTEEVTPELQALYDKQAEIDAILFKTNASDLEAKDIFVNYTGVTGDYIEVGIATYSDEKADFIYELVGKDQVKVVEFDDSIMYASGLPTVEGSGEDGSTGAADPLVDPIPYGDGIANSGIAPDETTSDGNEEKVYKGGEEEDGIMTITSDNSVTNESDVVKTTSADSKDADAMSTPMMILIVAGAAVVIGGAVTVANKNKNKK